MRPFVDLDAVLGANPCARTLDNWVGESATNQAMIASYEMANDLKAWEPKDIKEFNSKTFKILCDNVAFDAHTF
jgi:hypothetical protein